MSSNLSSTSPSVVNMLVCDGAHRDPGSGKWTLLGLFNSINTKELPTVHPQMVVYVAIANVEGKMPLRFQIVSSDRKDEILFKIDAELTVNTPRGVAEVAIPVRGVRFTKPGEHLLQVLTQDRLLGERPINVNKV